MKNNMLAILAVSVLSGIIVTGSTLAALQPIFASSEEGTTSEDESQDQTGEGETGSGGSDESETSETDEGNNEGVDNTQNDETSDGQQLKGSEIDELGGNGVASQQSGACPAVAIGGPTYDNENGCPVPCPKSGGVDSIPEGCPQQTDGTTTSDAPDTVPTTQTPLISNPENTGVGQPIPPQEGNEPGPQQGLIFPTPPVPKPNYVLEWWNTLFSEYYHPDDRSQSSNVPNAIPPDSTTSDIPNIAPTQSPNTPSSENTGVEQPIQSDKTDNLLGPRSSELQRTPDSVLTQNSPDTLFSGPKTAPGGGEVPLGNPDLVPNREGPVSEDCIVKTYYECNFPYPYYDDEICRNGIDDDRDGKVDEAYPCSEVPGVSQPKPKTDDVLVPIPSDGLVPK